MLKMIGCHFCKRFPSVCRWVPVFIFLVFFVGVTTTWLDAEDYSPSAFNNALDIKALQRQVYDLGDVTGQFNSIRDRITSVEINQKEQGLQLDTIARLGWWAVFGIGGILGTQILLHLFRQQITRP